MSEIDVSQPDIRIEELAKAINKLPLERITNKDYQDTTIYLDGREFIDCTFQDCQFIVSAGHYRLVRKERHGHLVSIKITPRPPAAGVVSLLNLVQLQWNYHRQ